MPGGKSAWTMGCRYSPHPRGCGLPPNGGRRPPPQPQTKPPPNQAPLRHATSKAESLLQTTSGFGFTRGSAAIRWQAGKGRFHCLPPEALAWSPRGSPCQTKPTPQTGPTPDHAAPDSAPTPLVRARARVCGQPRAPPTRGLPCSQSIEDRPRKRATTRDVDNHRPVENLIGERG